LKFESGQPESDTDIQQIISGRESRKQIMEIVERLGETCKEILLAVYYENLSMKDILSRLDFENEQVVRNKKYKCLKQLERMLIENPSIASTLKSALHYE
jgi:DNA-directed RNA polymerase specialized sigma subunit